MGHHSRHTSVGIMGRRIQAEPVLPVETNDSALLHEKVFDSRYKKDRDTIRFLLNIGVHFEFCARGTLEWYPSLINGKGMESISADCWYRMSKLS